MAARRQFTADEIVELVCLPDGANSDDSEVTDDGHDDETKKSRLILTTTCH